MATVHLTLKFETPSLTGFANAWVVPQSYNTDEDGSILLTPECASIEELEANIAIMRADLDEILTEAKRRFALAEANPQSIFHPN